MGVTGPLHILLPWSLPNIHLRDTTCKEDEMISRLSVKFRLLLYKLTAVMRLYY